MRKGKYFILFLVVSLIFTWGLVFAQDTSTQPEQGVVAPAEPEVQWLLGDVISVDLEKQEFLVKSLDYETDTEKEITINIDDKTTYENVKSIDEIKPQDTVSIDYTVSPDGKNIAKNISVEKPEEPQAIEEETLPSTTQP